MIALARAAFLGHRVLQRDTSEPVLSAEQKLGWREFREQLRQHERDLEAGLQEKQEGVAALLSEMIALAERMRRHRSEKIAKTVIREKRRLVDLAEHRDELRTENLHGHRPRLSHHRTSVRIDHRGAASAGA